MISNEFNGFFSGLLTDKRLEKRAEKVMADILTFGKVVVNKFCSSSTEKIGAYRMFNNKKIKHKDLAKGVFESCKKNQGVNHLLCIQDTTEINFHYNINRIGKENIGSVSSKNAGIFCHPMLIVDPILKMPIGLSSIELWNRTWKRKSKKERLYKSQHIKEKESYRWIKSALNTKELLTNTPILTVVGDRESDIYEEFVLVPDSQTHLLVRSNVNRNLFDSDIKLHETLAASQEEGTYTIEIKGNRKRKTRTAKMSLRFKKVRISKSKSTPLKDFQPYVDMWAIETRELQETVPVGEELILWRLLTTHTIETFEDACQCVDWYSQRWLIEELFRILKKKGLEIETTQLETEEALKKLITISLQVALVTMTLKLSINNSEKIKAELIFTKEQIQFLGILVNKLEGNTVKQKNPYPKESLAWAAWTIARLSGWSGYKSHGPPGYISIKEGLDIFYNRYEGYLVAMEFLTLKDVYKE